MFEFFIFYLYLCHVLLLFTLVLICNTKIGEKSDMAQSWATRLCRLPQARAFCCSGTYKNNQTKVGQNL